MQSSAQQEVQPSTKIGLGKPWQNQPKSGKPVEPKRNPLVINDLQQ